VTQTGEAGGAGERDGRGADAAAGTLDEDAVAGLDRRVGEQHPVGRQPGGRQARGLLEGQVGGLREQVAARHDDLLGERPLVPLGQDRPLRVERLVAHPVRVADEGMHDDLVPLLVDAGGVAPQHHRQPVGGQADALERPQVVVVQRCCAHGDQSPAVGYLRGWPVTDGEAGERVVGGLGRAGDGEHPQTVRSGAGALPHPVHQPILSNG
jgi:hypothetical protein